MSSKKNKMDTKTKEKKPMTPKSSKSSKSPKSPKSGKKSSVKPSLSLEAEKRPSKLGVSLDVKLKQPQPIPPEEAIKRFGPCHVEATQAHTAILLLRSEEQNVVIESLNCLQKFCKKRPENKEIFAELGGAEEALKLIFNDHQVIQRLALKLLAMASPIHKIKLFFRDMSSAKDMVTLAQSKDDVVVEYATVILSNTATLYTGRVQIIQSEGIPVLVGLLANSDPDIQKNSAEAIYRILEESMNTHLLADHNDIKAVIKLCDSEYPAVQVIALSILEKVSKRYEGVQLLENVDVIPSLSKKLGNPELVDVHRVILKTMINMASSIGTCRLLSSSLVQILDILDNSKDIQAQILAVLLIGKMASIASIAKGLVDLEIVHKIVEILDKHADNEIREAAAFAAAQLAASDFRAKEQLVEAIPALIKFFGAKDISNHACENVMLAFSTILEEPSYACADFINQGGIKLLLKIFGNNTDYSDETIISAMTCVSLLAMHWELRRNIIDRGLVGAIVACLDKSNPQLLALSASAICGLLCDEEGRMEFMRNGGIKSLIDLVLNAEFPVITAAASIVQIIGSHQKLAIDLVENGLLQAIWQRQDLISRNGPFRTAYERLVASHLPAKFAITGHIDPFEKLPNGFYDSGHLKKGEKFTSLKEMHFESHDPSKRILYLNLENQVEPGVLEQHKSLQTALQENQTIDSYIHEIMEYLGGENVRSEKALVGVIATVIAGRLGGQLDKWRLSAESEDLEIADLQNKHESVVIPVTMLTNGAQRPRALIFKALADRFGIPCTLDRGGYKKHWNVILLSSRKRDKNPCPCVDEGENNQRPAFTEKLRRYVVDLIYQPGSLFPINSYDANAYCFY